MILEFRCNIIVRIDEINEIMISKSSAVDRIKNHVNHKILGEFGIDASFH